MDTRNGTTNQAFVEFARRMSIRLLPDSHVPMYHQLARVLEFFIEREGLSPGDRLPSEQVVAECFEVNRATASKAFQELLDQGWLSRRQGFGTFIERPKDHQLDHLINLDKLIQQFRDRNIVTHDVHKEIMAANQRVASALQIEPGAEVSFLRRVRIHQGQPLLVVDCYLSAERFPDFLSTPLVDESVYATLQEKYGCRVAHSRRWLESGELLQGDVSELLDVPILSPILLMRGVTVDTLGEPAVTLTSYIREGVALTCEVGRVDEETAAPNTLEAI